MTFEGTHRAARMRPHSHTFLLIFAAMIGGGCGGAGSGSSESGIEASFSMMNVKSIRNEDTPPAHDGQTFYTEEGRRIDLENGFISVSVSGLTGCSLTMSDVPGVVGRFFVSSASAHGNAVEAPAGVIDVSETDGTSFDLGILPAVPGNYCGVELELVHLPHNAPGGDHGALVYLAPCYFPQLGETNHSCYQIPVVAAAPAVQLAFPVPMTLNGGNRQVEITVRVEYDTWFDGVDVPALAQGDAQAGQRLLDNIVASFQLADP